MLGKELMGEVEWVWEGMESGWETETQLEEWGP